MFSKPCPSCNHDQDTTPYSVLIKCSMCCNVWIPDDLEPAAAPEPMLRSWPERLGDILVLAIKMARERKESNATAGLPDVANLWLERQEWLEGVQKKLYELKERGRAFSVSDRGRAALTQLFSESIPPWNEQAISVEAYVEVE